MTTVKLISKSQGINNYAIGDMDLVLWDGSVQTVSGLEAQSQMVGKCIVSKMDLLTGFGCSVKEFRGMKDLNVMKAGLALRIMRGLAVMERMYNEEYEVQSIQTNFEKDKLNTIVNIHDNSVSVFV